MKKNYNNLFLLVTVKPPLILLIKVYFYFLLIKIKFNLLIIVNDSSAIQNYFPLKKAYNFPLLNVRVRKKDVSEKMVKIMNPTEFDPIIIRWDTSI